MATALDLIKASLRDIGVLAAGETPAFDDSNDALSALNRLSDQWSAERLQMYTVTRETWTLVASQQQYTFGTGGDITTRPVYIENVNFIDTSQSPDAEYPLDRMTEQAWASIMYKAQTSDWPTVWYYNPVYPLGTLDFWPVPTSGTLEGAVYYWTPAATFANLDTAVALPPGYERMIVKNLALEISPSYGVQVHPQLAAQALDSVATVKRANKRIQDLSFDPGSLAGSQHRTYNIYQG